MDGKITEAQKRAVILMKEIETSCIEHGLNMTIYDGKIGFVDPEESKIVASQAIRQTTGRRNIGKG